MTTMDPSLVEKKRALLAKLLRHKAAGSSSEYLLSHGQRALWYLYNLDPSSCAYNTVLSLRVHGRLELDRLERALHAMLRRHPCLRSTIKQVDGVSLQCIEPSPRISIEVVDTANWSEERLGERLLAAVHQPFDLANGPTVRAALFARGADDFVLLLMAHHIVIDTWSVVILCGELPALYSAPDSLPPPRSSYAEFVEWQSRLLDSEAGQRHLAYWLDQLAGAPTSLDLPADRPRPALQTFHGATHPFTVPRELCDELAALAKREGATLYMVLLAAFQVLLSRLSGQDDILVGSPMSGRTEARFEGVVGYFVSPVVLRARISGNPSFRSFLREQRRVVLQALEHQDCPFPVLVERLHLPHDPSRSPLFQAMFALRTKRLFREGLSQLLAGGGGRVTVGELEFEPFDLVQQEGQFDLSLDLVELETGLSAHLQYNTDLFEAESIARFAGHYQTLLESIAAALDRSVTELPMLTASERAELATWNRTATPYDRSACVHDLFGAQVKLTPDATAVVFGGKVLSYAELDRRASRLAQCLKELGVAPDVPVGLCLTRGLDLPVALLGILKAGGAYVPLDPDFPAARLTSMLEGSRAPVLVTQRALAGLLETGARRVYLDDLDSPGAGSTTPAAPEPALCTHRAYVIFTSGSTGKPKGVQIEHRAVVNFLLSMRERPGLTGRDTLLAVTTVSFDIAALEILLPLVVGARLVIAGSDCVGDGLALARMIESSQATVMQATPATWRLLIDSGWRGCPHLKILCGGEALPRRLADELLERCATLWNMYGPTETTIWSSVHQVEPGAGEVPIGRPIANTQLHVRDALMQPVPAGVVGELYIGGDGLARGYLDLPQLTAERFVTDRDGGERLYRTGDLARHRADGLIEVLGRADFQVKIRGYRIELGEIESTLARHPAVRDCVVTAREENGDRRLAGYLITRTGLPVDADELRQFLQATLPDYMVPSSFTFLDKFPLTGNGKIDRKALPAPHSARPQLAAEYVAPQTELERQLAAIWSEVLHVERVGIDDSFYDLGGHSLLAIQLQSRVRKELQRELPVVELLGNPTIRSFAARLDPQTAAPGAPIPSLDLEAEAVLAPELVPASVPGLAARPTRILLTGATGFIGPFLLQELLDQTDADVFCLVRAGSAADGQRRLLDSLRYFGLDAGERHARRIVPVLGDLALPLLGITPAELGRLAAEVDAIYHNAAQVNWGLPYTALRLCNVSGTHEVIRLACSGKPKHLHHVSTTGVYSLDSPEPTMFGEELTSSPPLPLGYAQSKWVAERMVQKARSRGIQATVHRPPFLTSEPSTTGIVAANHINIFPSFLVGCLQLGYAPKLDSIIDIVPVDYLARAMVWLSCRPDAAGKSFNFRHPQPVSYLEFYEMLRSCGHPLEVVPYGAWREKVMNLDEDNALYAFRLFFTLTTEEMMARIVRNTASRMPFEDHSARDELSSSDIKCPPIDTKLIGTYLSDHVRQGRLRARNHELAG